MNTNTTDVSASAPRDSKKGKVLNSTNLLETIKEKDLIIKRLKFRMDNVTTALKLKARKLHEAMEEIEGLNGMYSMSSLNSNETIRLLNNQVYNLQKQLLSVEDMLDKSMADSRVRLSELEAKSSREYSELKADSETKLEETQRQYQLELAVVTKSRDEYKELYESQQVTLGNYTKQSANLQAQIQSMTTKLNTADERTHKILSRQSFIFKVVLGVATVVFTALMK